MYKTCKERLDEEYHQLFNKMEKDIEEAKINHEKLRQANFNEIVLLKFSDEDTYSDVKKVIRNFKKKLKRDDQFIQYLKDNEKEVTERDVQEYAVEFMEYIKKKKGG